jgi:hypothetical protein
MAKLCILLRQMNANEDIETQRRKAQIFPKKRRTNSFGRVRGLRRRFGLPRPIMAFCREFMDENGDFERRYQ